MLEPTPQYLSGPLRHDSPDNIKTTVRLRPWRLLERTFIVDVLHAREKSRKRFGSNATARVMSVKMDGQVSLFRDTPFGLLTGGADDDVCARLVGEMVPL